EAGGIGGAAGKERVGEVADRRHERIAGAADRADAIERRALGRRDVARNAAELRIEAAQQRLVAGPRRRRELRRAGLVGRLVLKRRGVFALRLSAHYVLTLPTYLVRRPAFDAPMRAHSHRSSCPAMTRRQLPTSTRPPRAARP